MGGFGTAWTLPGTESLNRLGQRPGGSEGKILLMLGSREI